LYDCGSQSSPQEQIPRYEQSGEQSGVANDGYSNYTHTSHCVSVHTVYTASRCIPVLENSKYSIQNCIATKHLGNAIFISTLRPYLWRTKLPTQEKFLKKC